MNLFGTVNISGKELDFEIDAALRILLQQVVRYTCCIVIVKVKTNLITDLRRS